MKEIEIDLSKYESIIDLHQYSDSLKVVKLETTEECLIGRIGRIIEDDSLLFLLDKQSKSILVFHSSGRFSHSIYHEGKGNGDYLATKDIAVDKKRNVIYVYDDHTRLLICYDYQGGFLRKISLPVYAGWLKV